MRYLCIMLFIVCSLLLVTSQNQLTALREDCYTSMSIDINLEVFDTENVQNIVQLAEVGRGDFSNFTLTPNNDAVVVATPTNALIYSLYNNPAEPPFLANCKPITQLAISSDNLYIALVERNSTSIQLWSLSSNSLLSLIETNNNQITSLAFNGTGTLLAWGASSTDVTGEYWIEEGSVSIYALRTSSIIGTIEGLPNIISELQFSLDADNIMFRANYPGYDNFAVQIWDVETQSRLTNREAWFILPAYSHSTSIVAYAVTTSLGITNEFSNQLEIRDLHTNTLLRSISISNGTTALALNSNATLLASGNVDGVVTIWDTQTLRELTLFHVSPDSVRQLTFSNDGKRLISLGTDVDNQIIRVWGIYQ